MTVFEDPAVWGLVAGVPVAAGVVYRGRRTITRLRNDLAKSEQRSAALQDELTGLREHLDLTVQDEQRNAEEDIKAVLTDALRTMQGDALQQRVLIDRAQQVLGDQPVLRELMQIDHSNAQLDRRAQSIIVLCGGPVGGPGRQAPVYDVIRSAKGRIRQFNRVELRSQSSLAVVAQAVEPLALALAELLDNATSYSNPTTTVEINLLPNPNGLSIVIDDAGVGMSDEERTKATRLLTGAWEPRIAELGRPPQFGFPVIGTLAKRAGFRVSVDTASIYGGVRAVVFLPQVLLTTAVHPEEPQEVRRMAEAPRPVEPQQPGWPPQREAPPAEAPLEGGPGGLPRRRRFAGPFSVVPDLAAPSDDAVRDGATVASRIGAFQNGTNAGRATSPEGYAE